MNLLKLFQDGQHAVFIEGDRQLSDEMQDIVKVLEEVHIPVTIITEIYRHPENLNSITPSVVPYVLLLQTTGLYVDKLEQLARHLIRIEAVPQHVVSYYDDGSHDIRRLCNENNIKFHHVVDDVADIEVTP